MPSWTIPLFQYQYEKYPYSPTKLRNVFLYQIFDKHGSAATNGPLKQTFQGITFHIGGGQLLVINNDLYEIKSLKQQQAPEDHSKLDN